ncbi:DegT/DnrJ/EryC1/StrS family aminotransferase [Neiella marina]|uniref:DegT/DnrJ/EryC1/StrS family aminotransferase n=1 Tax=Neiella holothuriorum TaxID=2870530 RepID=A0ABS7EER0_9GAMM|nr:DegT/DnrJ/EryC1/StrS family aminotransferase [Neiella holothuriorum]MBW8190816.1 DegT/DnrJ/EryC1/StrS family aminotransferase [Neiella holothuriorum]
MKHEPTARTFASSEPRVAELPVAFIENKPIDYAVIANLLEGSRQRNHWANYGPASLRLEYFLEQKLHLPATKSVVMCKSGTAALHTLVNLEEIKAGRKLNWVISSFGFIASNVGCLNNATIVDCDKTGMLSLKALSALPVDSWDGLVVTNTFGLCSDISDYEALCHKLNKKLVIDNAVGLFSDWRHASSPNEAISFHQTKPWGIGEGGCMIADSADVDLIRDMISFGRGRAASNRQYYSNEKLADVNAAAIMAWMQQMFEWYPAYMEQAERIVRIAVDSSLEPLQPLGTGKIYGNIPLLAKQEIPLEKLNNESVVLMKYYFPLKNTPTASSIYRRIFNMPCHQHMAALSNSEISALLTMLAN